MSPFSIGRIVYLQELWTLVFLPLDLYPIRHQNVLQFIPMIPLALSLSVSPYSFIFKDMVFFRKENNFYDNRNRKNILHCQWINKASNLMITCLITVCEITLEVRFYWTLCKCISVFPPCLHYSMQTQPTIYNYLLFFY